MGQVMKFLATVMVGAAMLYALHFMFLSTLKFEMAAVHTPGWTKERSQLRTPEFDAELQRIDQQGIPGSSAVPPHRSP